MGILDRIFDFDGDGKVGFFDDMMLLGVYLSWKRDEEKRQRESDSFIMPLEESLEEIRREDPEEIKRREAEERQRRISAQINELYTQLLQVPLARMIEHKEQVKEAKAQYQKLLKQLEQLEPEDTNSPTYIEWAEMVQTFRGHVDSAQHIYQVLNGDDQSFDDPLATKGRELAVLRRNLEEWEEREPEDSFSEGWDAWEERREELEEELSEVQEAYDDLALERAEEDAAFSKAIGAVLKMTEELTPDLDDLEKVIKIVKRVIPKLEEALEQCDDKIWEVKADLEDVEPQKMSLKRGDWEKQMKMLEGMEKRVKDLSDALY